MNRFQIRIIVLLVALAAIAGGLWFARGPILAGVKEWRSASLVSKAERAAERGGRREATQSAAAAWQLGPKKLATLQRLLEVGRELALPELSGITLLLFFHEDAAVEDRVGILRWALDRGDVAFHDQLYPNLDEEEKGRADVRLLVAEKLGLQGRLLEGIEEARAIEGEEGAGPEVSLLLARLLAHLPTNPAALDQGAQRAVALLEHADDEVALKAWRTLRLYPPSLRDPGLGFDPLAWVGSKEDAHPVDWVFARRLVVERSPTEDREAALAQVESELREHPETIPHVIHWYLESGLGERLLSLPEEPFLDDPSVFSARLQVLLDLDRFEDAARWLEKAPDSLPESLSGSLQAVFASRAGRPNEALSAWRRVIDRASSLQLYSDCSTILRIAHRFGEARAVGEVISVIERLPPSRLPPSEHLEFLEYHFQERPLDWLAFWREILRHRPGDGLASEQVAFLQLMEPGDVGAESVLRSTEALLLRFPNVARFRVTHCLWLLREDRDEEALRTMREADVNWNEADALSRAVLAEALRRNGASDEAGSLLGGIRWEGVGPIRHQVLRAALGSPPAGITRSDHP